MEHIELHKLRSGEHIGKKVAVCGWVRTSRDSKNVAFAELNDGSELNHMQIVFDKAKFDDKTLAPMLALGSALRVVGTVEKGMKDESVEILAESAELLGGSDVSYPLQKKRHTMEFLRTIPHLRVRTNTFNAVFRVRSELSYAIHEFFHKNGYYYVHSPIITGSDCEGAGEVFKVTTVGYDPSIKSEEEYNKKDFFGRSAGLTVSGQLEEIGRASCRERVFITV